jgi:hypothetical protein
VPGALAIAKLGALPGTQQPDNRGAANPELLGDGRLLILSLRSRFISGTRFTPSFTFAGNTPAGAGQAGN